MWEATGARMASDLRELKVVEGFGGPRECELRETELSLDESGRVWRKTDG